MPGWDARGTAPNDQSLNGTEPCPLNPPQAGPVPPQKLRTGLQRVWYAAGYSLQGLRAGQP